MLSGTRCLKLVPASQVWSMGFVFDCTGEGRVIKYLVIVGDATHEALAVEVDVRSPDMA
ncbi:hypothetical protein QE400_003217 [Xanthomonas sacchari]|nr:hypothetical protein [Xanthomonas sacchari]